MPKIFVEYEITRRISVEVEVSEGTVAELEEHYDLKPLERYGITPDELYEKCDCDGWMEEDYAVTAADGTRIIPWTDE